MELLHLPEEAPHAHVLIARTILAVELVTRPFDGGSRTRVEIRCIKHRPVLMIAEQGELTDLHHLEQDLPGLRAIAYDVPQADHAIDTQPLCLGQADA